jgi:hypothetical protein
MLRERRERLKSLLAQIADLHAQASKIYAEIPEGSPASEEEADFTQTAAENHHQESYFAFAEIEDLPPETE